MKKLFFSSLLIILLGLSTEALAYRLLTDKINGGNPKLRKKTYKVYIQADPRAQEVKDALNKWKAELGPRNIDLQLQQGAPPQTPLDLNKFNQEVKKFNDAIKNNQNPDVSDFPEIEKLDKKNCTINIYFRTTAQINQLGGGSERGKANNFWSLDAKGNANGIDATDIFLPTNPPGGNEDVKKRILHNIAMHEFGHMSGYDHYTEAQDKVGEIMETDATLHSTKLDLSPEETKGFDSIYGNKPKVDVKTQTQNQQSSLLPDHIKNKIPASVADVWLYNYDLTWEEGSPVSYFQIETNGSPIYFAAGKNGLDDWQYELPGPDEHFLEFFADSNYLGEDVTFGSLQFYTDISPGKGQLVYAGGSLIGSAPIPEPASFYLLGMGLLGGLFMKVGKR